MVASTNTWGTQTVVRRYRVNGYTVLVIADNVGSGTMTSRIPLVTVSGPYLEETVWYDETPVVNRRGNHVGVWSPFSAEALFPLLVPKPYHVHRHQVGRPAPWFPFLRACPSIGRGRSRWRGVFPKRWRGRRKRRSTC